MRSSSMIAGADPARQMDVCSGFSVLFEGTSLGTDLLPVSKLTAEFLRSYCPTINSEL
jgi:hypothetical protein